MLRHMIEVVQAGLGPALVVALLVAATRSIDRATIPAAHHSGAARVIAGAGAGAIGSVVLVVLRETTRIVTREWVNAVALALTLVACLVVIAALASPRARGGARPWLWPAAPAVLSALVAFQAMVAILLMPGSFAASGASLVTTDVLAKAFGYLVGLIVVTVAAIALARCARAASARLVRAVVACVLALVAVVSAVSLAQILLARRVIGMRRWLFDVVVLFANNEAAILLVLMALTLPIPLAAWRWGARAAPEPANPAQARIHRARALSRRRFCGVALSGYALAAVAITAGRAYESRGIELSPAVPVVASEGRVAIPLGEVDDWRLHRFGYPASGGVEVRFIVIRKSEAAYGVALDACLICGPTGYYERRGKVVCRLCDVVMNTATIGFAGGCNPIPLDHTLGGGALVIAAADLDGASSVFA